MKGAFCLNLRGERKGISRQTKNKFVFIFSLQKNFTYKFAANNSR
jgi:hypothetical protein